MATASTLATLGTALGRIGGAITLGAGALAIVDGVIGNSFNPTLGNNYTINGLTQFPADLPQINGEMFCILFQFYKYNRPSVLVAPTLTPYGAVALPIPSDLIDGSAQNYSEERSDLAVGAALENFNPAGGRFASVQQIAETLAGIGSTAGSVDAALGVQGISNIANLAGPNSLNKALAFAGVVQNPFLSVLFNSPTFKRHIFSWTFIPETAQDTEVLNYILNKFRYHSMPDVNSTQGGFLLNYPDMCVPFITPSGYMYDFKQCVIEGMSINYAPGDSPAFNTKNAPNAVKLTVKLLEIEYWIKSDLTNGSITSTAPAPYGSGA